MYLTGSGKVIQWGTITEGVPSFWWMKLLRVLEEGFLLQ